jgi:hypothetical protein
MYIEDRCSCSTIFVTWCTNASESQSWICLSKFRSYTQATFKPCVYHRSICILLHFLGSYFSSQNPLFIVMYGVYGQKLAQAIPMRAQSAPVITYREVAVRRRCMPFVTTAGRETYFLKWSFYASLIHSRIVAMEMDWNVRSALTCISVTCHLRANQDSENVCTESYPNVLFLSDFLHIPLCRTIQLGSGTRYTCSGSACSYSSPTSCSCSCP